VDTTVSAISPGTEMLVYRGEVRPDMALDETLEALSGSFSYPVRYGYAAVGTVVEVGAGVDPAAIGDRVLAYHPHASEFVVPADDVTTVPDGVAPETAALLPNVETAVNLVLDGAPRLGERVVVFGQGVVGLLTTAVLSGTPLSELLTVDLYARRRELSEALGADRSVDPREDDPVGIARGWGRDRDGSAAGGDPPDRADLVYELSGDPAALDDAIDATGYGGRVVVGSWYGTKEAELSLDGRFHRSRIRLVSSQVSTIAPELRGRWTPERRLDTAWERLASFDVEPLVTHRFPLEEAPAAYRTVDARPSESVQVLLTY
jgi:2-desacetyl-2-hydroxyethyl bacteriochlorophyllide A dehydrogenase